MANLFHKAMPGIGTHALAIWYHFALMFEALFILTTLDAGTRVGRYLLQDALGHLFKPLGDVKSLGANLFASALVVGLWGYFLIAAVYDPDGGIKALWPIFGIANQLLAATALCLATTVILKMALNRKPEDGGAKASPALALVTLLPLAWLLTVTGTAAVQKIWHSDPKIGFLAGAAANETKLGELRAKSATLPTDQLAAHEKLVSQTAKQVFNLKLDAVVTGFFLSLVTGIFVISLREWILIVARKKAAELRETPPTWLPDYALAEGRPLHAMSLIALSFALLKELSGEAAVDRAQQHVTLCPAEPGRVKVDLLAGRVAREPLPRAEAYVRAAEERFNTPNRCC